MKLLVLLLSAALLVPAGPVAASSTSTITLVSTRSYDLVAPPVPASPPRVVMVLHPLGVTTGVVARYTDLAASIAALGAYAVYPAGEGWSWNAGECCSTARDDAVDDVGFLSDVVADLSTRIPGSAGRIAVLGLSNGGMMAYRFACERPWLVSTYLVVEATDVQTTCTYASPVSLLVVHGLADTLVPWSGMTSGSPLTPDGTLPPVRHGLRGIGSADGCNGWTKAQLNSLVKLYVAQSCTSGEHLQVLISTSLTHCWPAGAASRRAFGLDAAQLVQLWFAARWNDR